jgi:hypothetical protein
MPHRRPLQPHLHGLAFRTGETEFHGATRGRLRGKDIAHPHHGVSAVDVEMDSIVGRCRAYEPLMARGQYFSHTTAAVLFGMPLATIITDGAPLHVSVLGAATRPRTKGIVGHGLSAGDVHTTLHLGFAVVAAEDTWCHLAAMLTPDDLVAVGDYLISGERTPSGREPPLSTQTQLADAAARHRGRRGTRALQWALPRLRRPVDSRPETLLRLLLIDAGYPEPLINDATVVDGGTQILHPDLKWPQWRIVLEYEGDGHRTSAKQFRADIRRKDKFEAAGWHVVRVTADDLFVDRAAFLERIARTVALRQSYRV